MLQNSIIGLGDAKPKILDLVKKTAESQFKIGEILKGLKDKVETFKKDDWKKKDSLYQKAKFEYEDFLTELPFGKVVTNKLIQIASDPAIEKYLDQIPFAYNTMYDLVGMPTKQWNFYFKNGLDGKSTAKDIKEMKTKWLEKTQPKVSNEEPTEQEVQEIQQEVEKLTGKKKLVMSEDASTAITKSCAEPVVEVKMFNTTMTSSQYDALEQVMNAVITKFFKQQKIAGEFEVSVNPNNAMSIDSKLDIAA